MKKIITILSALVIFTTAAFAQDVSWNDNVRAELDIALGMMTTDYELRGAYSFPISENLSWDAGVGFRIDTPSFLSAAVAVGNSIGSGTSSPVPSGFNIEPFASIWYKCIYLQYGFALDIIKDAGVGFNPYDVRFGWQPGFHKKDKGWCFKMEAGAISFYEKYLEKENEEDKGTFKKYRGTDFILTLGASYKF